MSYYVRVRGLHGRKDHASLGEWLISSGVNEVEYFQGGWQDSMVYSVAAHLKFENEGDAIAYILAHGGEISTKVPIHSGAPDDWSI